MVTPSVNAIAANGATTSAVRDNDGRASSRMRPAGPSQGSNSAPPGGSAAAKPQAWGGHPTPAGPSQGSISAAPGGSAAAKPQAWGVIRHPPGRPKGRI